ncbi:MAG: hypothetical protein HOI53_04880 [Francisellaceae bacterium]|jgi:hypothetical protein|nr:hypothetical protein [Francisellaceae bacterium]MBT6207339.1 hypothetical protein [Francisellaceae bacterium]MBT6538686.1 hypothetical protein [Francisellaceae bacterium]
MDIKKPLIYISILSTILSICLYYDRYALYFDATQNKTHVLSSKALSVLKDFDSPVLIDVYTPDIKLLNQVKDELSIYEHSSNNSLIISYNNNAPSIDIVKNPYLQSAHLLVASYNGHQQYLNIQKHIISESNFIKMLETLRLQNNNWIVFTSGNGERNPFSNDDKEVGLLMSQLQQQGLNVANFNLTDLSSIPTNTNLLVIAGASIELPDHSKNILRTFVQNKGSILWLVQPGKSETFNFLNDIIPIRVDDTISVDKEYQKYGLPSPGVVLGHTNEQHSTYTFASSLNLFPWAHKLSSIQNYDDWNISNIIQGNNSDILAIEASRGKQHIVVLGSVDFINNGVIENYSNLNTIMNIIRWQHMSQKPIILPSNNHTNFVISDLHAFMIEYVFRIIIPIILLSPVIFRGIKHIRRRRRVCQ